MDDIGRGCERRERRIVNDVAGAAGAFGTEAEMGWCAL